MDKLKIIFLVLFFFSSAAISASPAKKADLAGSWYPQNPRKLKAEIETCLNQAQIKPFRGEAIAIISPHAGLKYSGKVAAFGFKALAGKKIDTVIVVGFSHRLDYDKITVFDSSAYRTPLGPVYADKLLSDKLVASDKKINYGLTPFYRENSVEMLLPFTQVALGSPKVVLIAIGRQSWENSCILGEALYQTLKNENDFVIIASTDLSHYLSPAEAENIDARTAELIRGFDPEKLFYNCINKNRMCGTAAVTAAMIASRKLGADSSLILTRSDSGQEAGLLGKVVGYLSAVFIDKNKKKKEDTVMDGLLTASQKNKLIEIARKALREYVKEGRRYQPVVSDGKLKEKMGVFVTLRKNGSLRGCIGNIVARQPLYLGVRDMAVSAAVKDPRFPAVSESELKDIHIEISVLSPLEKIDNPDEIILGKHGVLVKKGLQSGVFLPQVADETGWSKEEFMNNLCRHKAGLSADCWQKGGCDIFIFSAEVFEE